MTQDEIGVLLNLRATLSEYEHFMTELSTMIERGVDVPPCGSAKFPMRDKLYAQVRDLVLGKSAMVEVKKPVFDRDPRQDVSVGDWVCYAGQVWKTVGKIVGFSPDGTMATVQTNGAGDTEDIPRDKLWNAHYDGK